MNNQITRRSFLGGSLGGFLGYALAHGQEGPLAQTPSGKAKRCVVLWMNGGPSQIDTFDPKPGMPTGGSFKAIETCVKGIRISEHLPQIAKRFDRLSVIRTLHSRNADHGGARYLLHTGYAKQVGFPRAAAGAVVSRESAPAAFPKHVVIGTEGFGPAYLGADHAPFTIDDPAQALGMFRQIERRSDVLRFAGELGRSFEETHFTSRLEFRKTMMEKIKALIDTPFVSALDLSREPAAVRARYGKTPFGRQVLLARRLLELGVPYVEVGLNGWDTHGNVAGRVSKLSRTVDGPWAALMDDLASSGLLDETVVVWMGEFGRTPALNGASGRDHYPGVSSVVIGGGGIEGGRVIGASDKLGYEIKKDPVSVPDLFATVFSACGIDPKKNYRNRFGAQATATDKGVAVRSLF